MEISGILAGDPTFGTKSTDSSTELGKDSFLRLLVEQLKNQDPMEPSNNEAMIAQLAQFSQLEEMQSLNQNILGMTVLQQNNALMSQLTGGTTLIGRTVSYIDPLTGETAEGEVFSVKIDEGLAVLNIDGKDVPLVNVAEVTQAVAATSTDDSDQ